MRLFLGAVVLLFSANLWAVDYPIVKTYNYEVTQNGVVVETAKLKVTYDKVNAGYSWKGCADDCEDMYYHYVGESYKKMYDYIAEEGYRVLAHSVPVEELNYESDDPKEVIVALTYDEYSSIFKSLVYKQVLKDFETFNEAQ